jgi:hypothetical protein
MGDPFFVYLEARKRSRKKTGTTYEQEKESVCMSVGSCQLKLHERENKIELNGHSGRFLVSHCYA